MDQKSFTLQGFKRPTDKLSKDNDSALRILQSEKPIVVLPGRVAVILNRITFQTNALITKVMFHMGNLRNILIPKSKLRH